MLYRMIIVDDELAIREGLCRFLNWEQIGFTVVSCFEDGREALSYLEQNNVDVVLTDIKMTDISGLNLAQFIHMQKPETIVVLVSGYKNFEYAKTAIAFGVQSYLTKPVNFKEIENVFTEIKIKLDDEKEQDIRAKQKEQRYQEFLPVLRQQFFLDLTNGALRNETEISRRMSQINLDFNTKYAKTCVIDIRMSEVANFLKNKWQYGKDRFISAIHHFFSKEPEDYHCFIIPGGYDMIRIVVIASVAVNRDYMILQLLSYYNEIFDSIKKVFELDFAINIGPVYDSIIDFACKQRITEYENNVQYTQKRSLSGKSIPDQLNEAVADIVSYFKSGETKVVIDLLDACLFDLQQYGINQVRFFVTDLFAFIYRDYQKLGIDLWSMTHESDHYHIVNSMLSIDEIIKWSKSHMIKISEQLNSNKNMADDKIIKQIENYIENNYDKDISLEDAARQVHLSSVYLSRFIKKKTGRNFSDYLLDVRMERAIKYMNHEKYKIQEISNMIGYTSSKYFSKLFKKYTGHSPSDYLRLIAEQRLDENGYQ